MFTKKKNSAALVCLVLAAALLAGGLVACESAGADSTPKLTAENRARRARLEEYFNASCAADSASVVLADLTGDGLDEMIVLTMAPESEDPPSLREGMTEDRFTYGDILCFGAGEDGVFQYPGSLRVSNCHAGWGYVYLVPRTDGDGFALLDFRPYLGQGSGSYIYSLYTADEEAGLVELEGDELMFLADQSSLMEDTTEHASREEAQALLDKVQAYRDSGVPLLVYNEGYDSSTGGPEFAYLNAPPADAFAADAATDLAALREQVAASGKAVQLPLPEGELSTPEAALDRLELTLYTDPDQVAFRLPNYTGDWDIQIAGRMRMGGEDSADFISVHYLEDAEWTPGKRYGVETEGAYFSELTLTATVTAPDGTQAERTILLVENGEETPEIPTRPSGGSPF